MGALKRETAIAKRRGAVGFVEPSRNDAIGVLYRFLADCCCA